MESEYGLQRLRAYASVFHKVWIELEFKDGKFVSLKKIDMGKDFKNTVALRGIQLGTDFYASKWNDKAYVPRENWWFNGHLLCNTDTRWTDRNLDILYYMFTNLQVGNINKTIVLNKRDYAWSKKDQTYPYPWNKNILPIEFHKVPMQTPLSFYGGDAWNDILVPIPEHWNIWFETELCRKITEKIPKIVFRGTLTGPFTDKRNDRIMAIEKCKNISWADVKFTDWTSRERLEIENGILNIKFPTLADSWKFGRKLTMIEQSKYEILLYIDGHVASSRKAWHLCSGSIVLCIKSSSQCPQQWFDSEWDVCPYPFTITPTTTHFECGIENVLDAANFILHLPKEIKSNIRNNCLTKAQKTFSKENMIKILEHAILVC